MAAAKGLYEHALHGKIEPEMLETRGGQGWIVKGSLSYGALARGFASEAAAWEWIARKFPEARV